MRSFALKRLYYIKQRKINGMQINARIIFAMEFDDHQPDIIAQEESHSNTGANRKTSLYMTKYERARLLGTRALQIRFDLFVFVFRWDF